VDIREGVDIGGGGGRANEEWARVGVFWVERNVCRAV